MLKLTPQEREEIRQMHRSCRERKNIFRFLVTVENNIFYPILITYFCLNSTIIFAHQ